eukprot:7263322-Prymnesium_polylepis.1
MTGSMRAAAACCSPKAPRTRYARDAAQAVAQQKCSRESDAGALSCRACSAALMPLTRACVGGQAASAGDCTAPLTMPKPLAGSGASALLNSDGSSARYGAKRL